MRFSIIAAAAMPLLALANPVVKRASDADVAAITTAIGYIEGNVTALDGDVNALGNDDTIGALVTLGATTNLQNAVTNAANVAGSVQGQFDDSQSGALSIPLTQLVPKVINLLNDIIAAKPKFQTALFGGDASFIVEANLKTSQTDTATFQSKLIALLSSTYQSLAPQVTAPLDAKFTDAINAYAS
jgi:hypothetical protein